MYDVPMWFEHYDCRTQIGAHAVVDHAGPAMLGYGCMSVYGGCMAGRAVDSKQAKAKEERMQTIYATPPYR